MSYCSKCGSLAKEGASFCDRCGAPLGGGFQSYSQGDQSTVSYTWKRDEKEPILAIILSVLIPGVGQMYCGKVGRGIAILLVLGLLSVVSFVPLFFITDPEDFDFSGFVALNILISVVLLIIYIWQIWDAYRCAESYNDTQVPTRY
jgi:TM2 domain-containing membrane protein YozV